MTTYNQSWQDLLQFAMTENQISQADVDDHTPKHVQDYHSKVRSNKATEDRNARMKNKLREKILSKREKQGVSREMSVHLERKPAPKRTLSNPAPAVEVEQMIPDLPVLSPPTLPKYEQQMSVASTVNDDIDMMSPKAPVQIQDEPEELWVPDQWTGILNEGQSIQDCEMSTSIPPRGLNDTSIDPVMSDGFENPFANQFLSTEIGHNQMNEKIVIEAIKAELKQYDAPYVAEPAPAPAQMDIMSILDQPMVQQSYQVGYIDPQHDEKKIEQSYGVAAPVANHESTVDLLFNEFGEFSEPAWSVPAPEPQMYKPPVQPEPNTSVMFHCEGRSMRYYVPLGSKMRAAMEKFREEAGLPEDEFFITHPTTHVHFQPETVLTQFEYVVAVTKMPKAPVPPKGPRRPAPKAR